MATARSRSTPAGRGPTRSPSAHNEFEGGLTYTDSFTVATSDGTTQVVTVTILGTNDAAVISGTSTASRTETDAVATASGTLAPATSTARRLLEQSGVAGERLRHVRDRRERGVDLHADNGHNEFDGGLTYTDSFTVATSDGTTQVVTVSILGTNDAAVISGTRRRR